MKLSAKLSLSAILLGAAGYANANCPLPESANAISVQGNAGQGGFVCDDLIGRNNTILEDLKTVYVDVDGDGIPEEPIVFVSCTENDNCNKPTALLNWEINPKVEVAGKYYEVFFVSAVHGGVGSVCNYLYAADESVQEGSNLGDASLGKADPNNTLVCGNPIPVDRTEEVSTTTIIDTEDKNCLTTVDFSDTTDPINQDVTVGFSTGVDGQTITICGNNVGAIGLGSGQVQCTPPPYVQQTPAALIGTDPCIADEDGALQLSCAPVDISGAPSGGPEYCWYYENRVCESGNPYELGYCDDGDGGELRSNTYIPRTKIDSFPIQVDVFKGSPLCYTTYFYGVAYITCYPVQ